MAIWISEDLTSESDHLRCDLVLGIVKLLSIWEEERDRIHKIGNSIFNNVLGRWACSSRRSAGPDSTILLRLALSELDKDSSSSEGMNNLKLLRN